MLKRIKNAALLKAADVLYMAADGLQLARRNITIAADLARNLAGEPERGCQCPACQLKAAIEARGGRMGVVSIPFRPEDILSSLFRQGSARDPEDVFDMRPEAAKGEA